MNLAQKTTVHVDSKKSSGLYVNQDTLKLLCDISSDLQRYELCFVIRCLRASVKHTNPCQPAQADMS